MNKNRILSVVITCVEKDKQLLQRCLYSLEKSANVAQINLDIIVILNGTFLTKPLKLISPLKYIKLAENVGFGQAINRGMSIARNPWCIILTTDTMSNQNTLRNLIRFLSLPKVAIITPKIYLKNGLDYTLNSFPSLKNIFLEQTYLYKSPFSCFKLPNSNINYYNYSHEAEAVACTFWLVNRSIFNMIGGFDQRFFLFYEDFDFCKRINNLGYKIMFVHNSKVSHIGHQSSGGVMRGDLYFESILYYFTKYHSKTYSIIVIFILFSGSLVRFIFWKILSLVIYNRKINNMVIFYSLLTRTIYLRILRIYWK